MAHGTDQRTQETYWDRPGLSQAILETLAALGKDVDALTIDDLAPLDQFHSGGKRLTVRLAHRLALQPGTRVLDVGGGLGGPARTLAVEYGCTVTVIDPTVSYVQAAEMLTRRLGLTDRVTHHLGEALHLPFDDHSFDVVWTQNSGMNIADKAGLYASLRRVLRPGGQLALHEPMAGPVQPPIFPVMWAHDATTHYLRTPAEMQALIAASGFRQRVWDDVTAETTANPEAPVAIHSIQYLVMGERLRPIAAAAYRNSIEGRLVNVQAIFDWMEHP